MSTQCGSPRATVFGRHLLVPVHAHQEHCGVAASQNATGYRPGRGDLHRGSVHLRHRPTTLCGVLSTKYEAITRGIVDAAKRTDRVALVDAQDHVIQFYLRHWGLDSASVPYVRLRNRSQAFVDSTLNNCNGSDVFYGQTTDATPENVAAIQRAVPFMVGRHDMDGGQTFLFTHTPGDAPIDDIGLALTKTPQATEGEGWSVDKDVPLTERQCHLERRTAQALGPRWPRIRRRVQNAGI